MLLEKYEKERDLQLRVMQYQINPHFIYNTLATIRAKALKNGETAVSEDIRLFSKMLGNVLSHKGKLSNIEKEMEILKDYIYFHKLRCGFKFDAEFEIDKSLYNFKIPNLLLQPIVENSILHGLNFKINEQNDAIIKISVLKNNGKIMLIVEDNGCGIDEQILKDRFQSKKESIGNSIGIRNVIERLKLIYSDKAELKIETQKDEYTKVIIEIVDGMDSEDY